MEGRGTLYEELGAVRDVVQNHLLQVLTSLAMDPPVGYWGEALRDERSQVLRAIPPLTVQGLVRGQYRGYLDEPGVAPQSSVETYAALELRLNTWRWQGVPFFLRAGKCLPVSATEVVVMLKAPPQQVFEEPIPPQSNYFRFRLGPDQVSIAIGARSKSPGEYMAGEEKELFMCDTTPAGARGLRAPDRRRAARRRRRCSRARTAWRPPGPSSTRCCTPKARCIATSPAAGVRVRPIAWWRRLVGGAIRPGKGQSIPDLARPGSWHRRVTRAVGRDAVRQQVHDPATEVRIGAAAWS